jgi:alanine-glyoxylate transaminase/serine-glyoxylate transaminase/serine-pyruvate transaminase
MHLTKPVVSALNPPERILLGAGPSPVPQRVLRALTAPTLGHLDPHYLAILDETCELLRQVFQTKNPLTFPLSGTGMAGMECCAANLLEPGDEAIVCINGFFSTRMKDVMERCGATIHTLEVPWGDSFSLEAIAAGLEQHPIARRRSRPRPCPRRLAYGGHSYEPGRP